MSKKQREDVLLLLGINTHAHIYFNHMNHRIFKTLLIWTCRRHTSPHTSTNPSTLSGGTSKVGVSEYNTHSPFVGFHRNERQMSFPRHVCAHSRFVRVVWCNILLLAPRLASSLKYSEEKKIEIFATLV